LEKISIIVKITSKHLNLADIHIIFVIRYNHKVEK